MFELKAGAQFAGIFEGPDFHVFFASKVGKYTTYNNLLRWYDADAPHKFQVGSWDGEVMNNGRNVTLQEFNQSMGPDVSGLAIELNMNTGVIELVQFRNDKSRITAGDDSHSLARTPFVAIIEDGGLHQIQVAPTSRLTPGGGDDDDKAPDQVMPSDILKFKVNKQALVAIVYKRFPANRFGVSAALLSMKSAPRSVPTRGLFFYLVTSVENVDLAYLMVSKSKNGLDLRGDSASETSTQRLAGPVSHFRVTGQVARVVRPTDTPAFKNGTKPPPGLFQKRSKQQRVDFDSDPDPDPDSDFDSDSEMDIDSDSDGDSDSDSDAPVLATKRERGKMSNAAKKEKAAAKKADIKRVRDALNAKKAREKEKKIAAKLKAADKAKKVKAKEKKAKEKEEKKKKKKKIDTLWESGKVGAFIFS